MSLWLCKYCLLMSWALHYGYVSFILQLFVFPGANDFFTCNDFIVFILIISIKCVIFLPLVCFKMLPLIIFYYFYFPPEISFLPTSCSNLDLFLLGLLYYHLLLVETLVISGLGRSKTFWNKQKTATGIHIKATIRTK